MSRPFDAAALQGTWLVVASTFPMWTSGTRFEPTFTYSNFRSTARGSELDDSVRFRKANGRLGRIEGIDRQHPDDPTRFTWRGRGWLWLFRSQWSVPYFDAERAMGIVVFSKTLATPAGLDLIARAPLSDEAFASLNEIVEQRRLMNGVTTSLVRLT